MTVYYKHLSIEADFVTFQGKIAMLKKKYKLMGTSHLRFTFLFYQRVFILEYISKMLFYVVTPKSIQRLLVTCKQTDQFNKIHVALNFTYISSH